jgi:hypothetical protein
MAFKFGRFIDVDQMTINVVRCDVARIRILTGERKLIDSSMADFKITLWGNFPPRSYWQKKLPQNKQFCHNVYLKDLKIIKKLIGRIYYQ